MCTLSMDRWARSMDRWARTMDRWAKQTNLIWGLSQVLLAQVYGQYGFAGSMGQPSISMGSQPVMMGQQQIHS